MRVPSCRPAALLLSSALGLLGVTAGEAFARDDSADKVCPVELPAAPGYTYSRPKQIDETGDIVGQTGRMTKEPEPIDLGAVWRKHRGGSYSVEVLQPLPGLVRSEARGFGLQRAPIGSSYLGATRRAAIWVRDPVLDERVPVDLEPPPGFTDAQAFAANPRGLIVGEASNLHHAINGSTLRHAVVWFPRDDGTYGVCDLGVPDAFDTSTASDVNDAGLVVGLARRRELDGAGRLRARADAVVWRLAGSPADCGFDTTLLPARDDLPVLQNPALSATGDVVARADRQASQPIISRALLWQRQGHVQWRVPVELPVPQGFTDAFARDVDASGDVLGTVLVRISPSGATTSSQIVIWKRERRGLWRVEVLPNPAGSSLAAAEQMDERGDVIGTSVTNTPGSSGGFVWRRDCGSPESEAHEDPEREAEDQRPGEPGASHEEGRQEH